jgi:hypothetical protein
MSLAVTAPLEGTTRFARYAFMPNRLSYCGGDDNTTIFQYALEDAREPTLEGMLRKFTGALPYLRLIAEANAVADPFDPRVVEAYWIGNELLDRVEARALHDSLRAKYRGQFSARTMELVAAKAPEGARPHHSFHVFDVWRRAEPGRGDVLATIDACRISWGTVTAVEAGELAVLRRPLVFEGGRLALGEPRTERVTRLIEGRGFATAAAAGDVVSIHWGWVCEVLAPRQARALERWTAHHLAIANRTL